jgi:hypothetical protein
MNEGNGRITTDIVGGVQLGWNPSAAAYQQRWGSNAWGPTIEMTTTTTGLILLPGRLPFGRWSDVASEVNKPFTVVVGVTQTSGNQSGYRNIWAQQGSLGLYLNGGKIEWYNTTTSRQTLTPDVPHIISVTCAGPNTGANFGTGEFEYHIDGRLDCINNATTWGTRWIANQLTCGNDTFSEQLIGSVSFIYVYDRYIGDGTQTAAAYDLQPTGARGEMASLHADPFDMFRPAMKYWIMGATVALTVHGSGSETFQHPLLSATGLSVTNLHGTAAEIFSHPLLSGAGTSVSNLVGSAALSIGHPTLAGTGLYWDLTTISVYQSAVEVTEQTDPNAIVTQVAAEVAEQKTPAAVVTQVAAEVAEQKALNKAVVTQVAVEAVFAFTQCAAEIPPGVYDFDQCEDWPSQEIVPGTDPLVP